MYRYIGTAQHTYTPLKNDLISPRLTRSPNGHPQNVQVHMHGTAYLHTAHSHHIRISTRILIYNKHRTPVGCLGRQTSGHALTDMKAKRSPYLCTFTNPGLLPEFQKRKPPPSHTQLRYTPPSHPRTPKAFKCIHANIIATTSPLILADTTA